MERINELFAQLAQYKAMKNEIDAVMDTLQDAIKEIMTENGVDSLQGNEHKCSWKEVKSNRFDSTAFKKDHADLAKEYTVETVSKRFTFA